VIQNEETENEYKENEDTGHKESENASLAVVTPFMEKMEFRRLCPLTDQFSDILICCLAKIRASFEQMVQFFGPPHAVVDHDEDACEKVDCEWQFLDKTTSEYVSFYNYRTGCRPDGKLDWSVGGKMNQYVNQFPLVGVCLRLRDNLPDEIQMWSIHEYMLMVYK